MVNKKLNQLKKEFYGDELLRYTVAPPISDTKYPIVPKLNNGKVEDSIADFITQEMWRDDYRNLYIENTFFTSETDFLRKDDSKRSFNNFYFDFDIDSDELDNIKKEIISRYETLRGKERVKEINSLRADYIDTLMQLDLFDKVYDEVKTFEGYLNSCNIKPYITFSGSKGFHIYIFLDRNVKLNRYKEISLNLATSFKDNLNLPDMDLSVNKDALKRKDRVVYSIHPISGLYATPITTDMTTDEIIKKSKRGRVELFDREDYTVKDDNFYLHLKQMNETIDRNIAEELEAKEKKKKKEREYKRKHHIYINTNANTDELFGDMRNLCKVIMGEPIKEYNEYNTYRCPFHDDTHASARVYARNFYCATDELHLTYFEFIRRYYNLKTDNQVKEKMSEISKAFKTAQMKKK